MNSGFELIIDGKDIDVRIKSNSLSKRVSVKYYNGYIVVVKPTYLSNKSIYKILNENRLNIEKDYKKYIPEIMMKEKFITSGTIFLYDGKSLEISIVLVDENKIYSKVIDDKLVIYISNKVDSKVKNTVIVKYLKELYKRFTYEFLDIELLYWSKILNLKFNNYRVKDVKTRWGSCAKESKNLNFSLRLAMMPKNVRASIIVHELCHLKEANHGCKFWKLVYKYIPDYDECKKWLKENSDKLSII